MQLFTNSTPYCNHVVISCVEIYEIKINIRSKDKDLVSVNMALDERFRVSGTASVKMTGLWDVGQCDLAETGQHLGVLAT
jgi:hypothetical protein